MRIKEGTRTQKRAVENENERKKMSTKYDKMNDEEYK